MRPSTASAEGVVWCAAYTALTAPRLQAGLSLPELTYKSISNVFNEVRHYPAAHAIQKETVVADPNLVGIRACVFDAYGTLFDFASAAAGCADVLGDRAAPLTALWRDKQLLYSWLRAVQGRHADFWQVTGDALDFALEALLLREAGLRERLMDLYLTLAAFPEVPPVLRALKAVGLATAILSNGSPPMLQAAVENTGLGDLIDLALSVEEVGVYKPHPKVYQLAVDRLALMPDAILFLSSNAWDAYAASAFGLRVVWCNRYGQAPERLPGAPDREIRSLAELPELLGASYDLKASHDPGAGDPRGERR
jgi:2-haloacid dehalogenase